MFEKVEKVDKSFLELVKIIDTYCGNGSLPLPLGCQQLWGRKVFTTRSFPFKTGIWKNIGLNKSIINFLWTSQRRRLNYSVKSLYSVLPIKWIQTCNEKEEQNKRANMVWHKHPVITQRQSCTLRNPGLRGFLQRITLSLGTYSWKQNSCKKESFMWDVCKAGFISPVSSASTSCCDTFAIHNWCVHFLYCWKLVSKSKVKCLKHLWDRIKTSHVVSQRLCHGNTENVMFRLKVLPCTGIANEKVAWCREQDLCTPEVM